MSSNPKDQKEGINTEDPKKPGVISEIADNLGAVFRHLLPGVLVIGAARVTHPSWFSSINSSSWSLWPFLAVVGVLAIATGNAWFTVNRYIIHQVIDCAFWHCKFQGPAKTGKHKYVEHLAMWVREAVTTADVPGLARQHVEFRASSVLLIYTLSELSLLAAWWSEPGTITAGCVPRIVLSVASFFLFIGALWQDCITRRIDAAILHKTLVPNTLKPAEGEFLDEQPAREQS